MQRTLNTVSVSLALGLVALAAWHTQHPESFHGSALFQVPDPWSRFWKGSGMVAVPGRLRGCAPDAGAAGRGVRLGKEA